MANKHAVKSKELNEVGIDFAWNFSFA